MTLITLICADKKKQSANHANEHESRFAVFTRVLPQSCTDEPDQNKFGSGFICVICGERFWPKAKNQQPIFYICGNLRLPDPEPPAPESPRPPVVPPVPEELTVATRPTRICPR